MAKTFVRQDSADGLALFKQILSGFDVVFAITGAGVWEKVRAQLRHAGNLLFCFLLIANRLPSLDSC